jgi:hypothetical protein
MPGGAACKAGSADAERPGCGKARSSPEADAMPGGAECKAGSADAERPGCGKARSSPEADAMPGGAECKAGSADPRTLWRTARQAGSPKGPPATAPRASVGIRPDGDHSAQEHHAALARYTLRAEHFGTPPRVHGFGSACCPRHPRKRPP